MADKNEKMIKNAVVLSGGGAKGAYQTGMFRAMEEQGFDKHDAILAGCSIGAMNALLYAISDTDCMRDFMIELGEKLDVSEEESAGRSAIDIRSERAMPLMERYYPDAELKDNRIPVYVCAYSAQKRRPVYIRLNELSPKDQRALTLASGSLPNVLPAVSYKGDHLSDGGVLPEIDGELMPPDKIPVKALADEKFGRLIVSFLKPEDTADYSGIPGSIEICEIRPKEILESIPGSGTLDFSKENLMRNEKLGYAECSARRLF